MVTRPEDALSKDKMARLAARIFKLLCNLYTIETYRIIASVVSGLTDRMSIERQNEEWEILLETLNEARKVQKESHLN